MIHASGIILLCWKPQLHTTHIRSKEVHNYFLCKYKYAIVDKQEGVIALDTQGILGISF